MNNSNLYIIGTVHNDPGGRERLDYLFKMLSPKIITLEMSHNLEKKVLDVKRSSVEREIDQFIKEVGLVLNSTQRTTFIENRKISKSINNYELDSARSYVDKNKNSRIEYIDIPMSPEEVEDMVVGGEEVAKNDVKEIVQEPKFLKELLEKLNQGVDSYRKKIKEDTEERYQIIGEVAKDYEHESEEMARDPQIQEGKDIISRFMKVVYNPKRDATMASRIRELFNPPDTLVSVVGMLHIHSLRSKLKDLDPFPLPLNQWYLIK